MAKAWGGEEDDMRTPTILLLSCALLLALPVAAEDVTGSLSLAGRGTSESGNLDRAAEYLSDGTSAEVYFDLLAPFQGFWLDVQTEITDTDQQRHALTFDVNRVFRSHNTYVRTPHRLEHDPLSNLKGAISDVKVLWSTDLGPDAKYGIRYSGFESRNELQIPGADWLILSANFREQWREGHRQSLNISHCSTCHVQSQGREVNQRTSEAELGARVALGAWSVIGTFASRDFEERGATPYRLYELVEQPALRTRIFDDRMQYDLRNGPLPYDQVPTTEREKIVVELARGGGSGLAFNLRGVTATTSNETTGNEVDYDAVGLTLGGRLGTRNSWSLRGRHYTIDSTDYFVDTVEPVGSAGPANGQTYRQRYGYDPDFLRQSAVNRDVDEADLRFNFRLGKPSTLSLNYGVRNIDREHYEVAVGETTTLEQRLQAILRLRAGKGTTFRLAATYGDVNNPFMTLDGACNPEAMQTVSVPSPLAPGSTQYYKIHEARVADLSSSPASWLEARLSGSFQLGVNGMASVIYNYWDGENNELDLTDWSKSLNTLTGMLSYAWSENSQLWAAATWGQRDSETHVCIPLMDG
jgi:hypothetical protein